MGRPKGGKNRRYTYEFKKKVVQEYRIGHSSSRELGKRYGISNSVILNWIRLYNEDLLKSGRTYKRGNPFAALHTSKSLSKEERLELENLKLRIENERLKKGYLAKGGGAEKEYVYIFDANTRSSEH